jgi:transcriptional regulator with PAS, ATPase and Fis domain
VNFLDIRKVHFTGASSDKSGYFEAAHEGTLFLDEIGDMPLSAQVKILRVLQEGTIIRLGDTREKAVDVRIIAATNRNLLQEISTGRFRSDLFYRLAVAVIKLPPLRERAGDISLLIDYIIKRINEDKKLVSGDDKIISPSAINFMLSYSWPGNIRELYNTLLRAYVWSDGDQ